MMRFCALLAIFTSLTSAYPFGLFKKQQQVCNGNAAYCDRKYPDVSFIGTHDSAFVGSILDPRVNQEKSVTDQLNAGIRFLQSQTHNDNGVLKMCHTSCLLEDAGPVDSYLNTVKVWMDAHPNEVLTILLTNGDNVPMAAFDDIFTKVGLKDYAFVPPSTPNTLSTDAWPTLSEMLLSKRRLVVFLDYGTQPASVPYILDEFAYFFETPYDTTDPAFPTCTLDRPPNSGPDGKMYILNHFLDREVLGIKIPANDLDFQTNSAHGFGSIGGHVDVCKGSYGGRNPKFVLVDMFNRGDVFSAERNMNGV